jgi:hypothetical protein
MQRQVWLLGSCLATVLVLAAARADGPGDNVPEKVRRVPKAGIEVPDTDRTELQSGLDALTSSIQTLRERTDPKIVELLPDVIIFQKAIHDALTYHEFFAPGDITKAERLLTVGRQRAEQLLQGSAPWAEQTGLVVRGYVSKIDGSVQPYGLVMPESYPHLSRARLDLWFHGRGETLSEVNFLDDRSRQPGTFTPADTIVLHPYGRYCNANKFAGEVDSLEALESVRRRYRIDDDRIAVRGFSMGGAACWHFAVHYADRWFAANPGAGFSETPRFLETFQKETLQPTWYERKLWHLYDCTDVAINLFQCPTVAYSGELDIQKQAADVMAEALRHEGILLTHIIGPQTQHRYHPDSRLEVERRLDSIAARGREQIPRRIGFATYTLKYNRMNWVTIDALGQHWERATVRAQILDDRRVDLRTENVQALTLAMPPGWSPFSAHAPVSVFIDGAELNAPRPESDRSWTCHLVRSRSGWSIASTPPGGLRKRHDLQGPIDDAFMDSFVFVRPTGTSPHAKFQDRARQESDRAIEHWRRQFRGDARVKDDRAVSDDDIAQSNLVLWGDPSSNAVLARIAERLPISWSDDRIEVGNRTYNAADHALILIAPNPLNPRRYVVLNSGFTYREYDYLNNARQVPKLPDWAVIDLSTPPDARYPGKVVAADFFGEDWKLRPHSAE